MNVFIFSNVKNLSNHLQSLTALIFLLFPNYFYFWNNQSTSPEGPLSPQSRCLIMLSVNPATMRMPLGRCNVWRPAGRVYWWMFTFGICTILIALVSRGSACPYSLPVASISSFGAFAHYEEFHGFVTFKLNGCSYDARRVTV